MRTSHLIPCPGCARHVRASELACPFCTGALPESLRATLPARRPPVGRLTRAALYTFSATSLTLAAACGSTTETGSADGSTVDAPGNRDSESVPEGAALYGLAPDTGIKDAGPDTASDAPEDVAPADSGNDTSSPPRDASHDGDSGGVALYGTPPFDASPHHDSGVAPAYGSTP
jgi:hypothetical protein